MSKYIKALKSLNRYARKHNLPKTAKQFVRFILILSDCSSEYITIKDAEIAELFDVHTKTIERHRASLTIWQNNNDIEIVEVLCEKEIVPRVQHFYRIRLRSLIQK